MVYYEQIDRLQKQYTDKYVVVDDSRPELRRFAGQTGIVKTVNMNGRALVQFDAFNNIGWYDIDPAYLRVVDAPLPKPEAKKEKAAPSTGDKAPPKAAAKPAAAKPAAPSKNAGSVADILAAARGGAKAAPAKPAEASAAPAAAPAAPKPAAASAKAMSVADILAAARGKGGTAAPAASPKSEVPTPAAAPVAGAPEPVQPPADPEPVATAPAAPASAAGGKRSKRDQITSIADMAAYCRTTDAK